MVDLCLATAAERRRVLPGDEVVPHPVWSPMSAVTISAPPERVWPWLVQMGAGRAGWYAYDHIDNGGVPSARRIVPGQQELAVGDLMPALPGMTESFIVVQIVPPRALILGVPFQMTERQNPPVPPRCGVIWAFVLVPARTGGTRLLVPNRVSAQWLDSLLERPHPPPGSRLIDWIYWGLARLPRRLIILVGGFGHYLMQRRQLRGIRWRAETRTAGACAG